MSAPETTLGRYVYDDAHGHRLTISTAGDVLEQRYVSLDAECMDIGGDCVNVWLPTADAGRLADALAGRVPFEYADHMGDTVAVAPAEDWTTFTVVRAAREDDETPVTVRVVVLTARLPQVRAALVEHVRGAELAEVVARVGALPMPVGPGPVVRPTAVHEAQIDALAASGNRAVNDANHDDLCMCDAWPEKCLSSGGYFQGYWDMGGLETAIPAVLGLWESMRGGELERLRKSRDAFRDQRNAVFATNERLLAEVQESDQARLRAENETRTVKREADALRARVAELEAKPEFERLSYAERAKRERVPARRAAWRMLAQSAESERVAEALLSPDADEPETGGA